MFTHGSALLLGLIALTIPAVPVLAEDLGAPVRSSASTVAPAYLSANYKQERVTASCTSYSGNGSLWVCRGNGTKTTGTRILVVGTVSCSAYATGNPTLVEVEFSHGTGTGNDWTDTLKFPLTKAFAASGTVGYSAVQPTQYVVPIGHRIHFETALTGTGMSNPGAECTYSGRLVAP
jgi:hypothetical protein